MLCNRQNVDGLRKIVIQVIKNNIEKYYRVESDLDDIESDDDESNSDEINKTMVHEFIMKDSEFDALLDKLPKIFDQYKVKYELRMEESSLMPLFRISMPARSPCMV